jgi:hypothetical protein
MDGQGGTHALPVSAIMMSFSASMGLVNKQIPVRAESHWELHEAFS